MRTDALTTRSGSSALQRNKRVKWMDKLAIAAVLLAAMLLLGCTKPAPANPDLPPAPPDNSSIGVSGDSPPPPPAGALPQPNTAVGGDAPPPPPA